MQTRFENERGFEEALQDTQLHFSKERDGSWWFREAIHQGYGQSIKVDAFKLYEKTAYQTLVVFYSERLGHVMVLDGAVQIAENNWRAYQEMLVGSALLPLNAEQRKLLIIGGGDGGVATIARLFFPEIAITMVEIDRSVTEAAKIFLPEISASLRAPDERFTLHIGDGIAFVANPENHGKFGAIIVDCTDPTDEGPAKGLFGMDFQANAKKCLAPGGVLLQQSGCLDMQEQEVIETHGMMKELFQYPMVLGVPMLTYPGTMALVGGSDTNVRAMNKELLINRFLHLGLDKKAAYFNPRVLLSAFELPQKLGAHLHALHVEKSFAGTRLSAFR